MTLCFSVLVSGRGSNLRSLLEQQSLGHLQAKCLRVLSDTPEATALEIARAHGVSTTVVPYPGRAKRHDWDAELLREATADQPDLIVLAGFMRLLGPTFIAHFRNRVINVHPSLLPSFPGLRAPAQAIEAGVKVSGCTVHLVDNGVDTGPILAQAAVPIYEEETETALHARIQTLEHRLLPAVIQAIATGQLALGDTPVWGENPGTEAFGSSASKLATTKTDEPETLYANNFHRGSNDPPVLFAPAICK